MSDQTYLVTDDETAEFVHATSENHAIAEYCDQMSVDITAEEAWGMEVERAEYMDGLPLTNYYMLLSGRISHIECICGSSINFATYGLEEKSMYLYGEDEDGNETAPHLVGEELFCSAACAAKHYEIVTIADEYAARTWESRQDLTNTH